MSALNLHATGLVVGTQGFLFVGPSGSGKTTVALDCLTQASGLGIFAALVGDDQVMVRHAGPRLVAEAIETISGLAELRGADIVKVPSVAAAVIDFAVMPITDAERSPRLPAEDEQFEIEGLGAIPLIRLPLGQQQVLDRLLRLAAARN